MIAMDDGVRLRTWTTGHATDRLPVVLLHGGPGLWDYLEPLARLLEPYTVVHRFDQRGCGGSDPSPAQSVARSVADVEALRRHWGYGRWIVAGHSFGATLALHHAWTHPGRTAGLVYLSGVGVGDWRTPYQQERDRRMSAQQRHRLAELTRRATRSPAEEAEFRTLAWFTDHADPGAGWRWAAADARHDAEINVVANRTLTADADRIPGADVLARARRLTMPCWFGHGTADPRPSHTVATLAEATPHGELHLLAGAGHQPWRERPAELRDLLHRLLDSVTASSHSA